MLTVDFQRLGLQPGDRVIDMGCGAGRHAFEMYRRGADVVAFDQDADCQLDFLQGEKSDLKSALSSLQQIGYVSCVFLASLG